MTKPTRAQEQACDRLVEALLLITEASRLDGKTKTSEADLQELVRRLLRISSVLEVDVLVTRALERRGKSLGLRSGAGELLMLMEGKVSPLSMLLTSDDEFRAQVEAMEAELGEMP